MWYRDGNRICIYQGCDSRGLVVLVLLFSREVDGVVIPREDKLSEFKKKKKRMNLILTRV